MIGYIIGDAEKIERPSQRTTKILRIHCPSLPEQKVKD
jgi:hypothetical protein